MLMFEYWFASGQDSQQKLDHQWPAVSINWTLKQRLTWYKTAKDLGIGLCQTPLLTLRDQTLHSADGRNIMIMPLAHHFAV